MADALGTARDWLQPLRDGRSKAERVADALADRIRDEGLPPGTFLGTKAVLRQQLQVSPATLDTALGVLTDRGVVEVRPGVKGGIRVADSAPSLWMGRSRWPARGDVSDGQRAGQATALFLALQPHIVSRAVGHLTRQDRSRLKAARQRLRTAAGDTNAYDEAHAVAHEALLTASHDDVLAGVVRTLMSIMDSASPAPDAAGHGQRPSSAEGAAAGTAGDADVHIGVIDAVLAADLEEAWRHLLDHGPGDRAGAVALPAGARAVQDQWRRSFR